MTSKSLPAQINEAAGLVTEKVTGLSRSATEKMDQTRTAAAGGLDQTASALHGAGEKVADLAHSAANKLSSSAEYIRNNDVKSMLAKVEKTVRENPGASLLVAGLVGFSVGRALRSSD